MMKKEVAEELKKNAVLCYVQDKKDIEEVGHQIVVIRIFEKHSKYFNTIKKELGLL